MPKQEMPVMEKPRPPKPRYDADAYVLHLSLAKLALEENVADAVPSLTVVTQYAAQYPKHKARQPILIVEYKTKDSRAIQEVLVPYAADRDTSEFPALRSVLQAMKTSSYLLYNIRPAVVTLDARDAADVSLKDLPHSRRQVSGALEALSKHASLLVPLAETQVQMRLARFFMQHHIRDGAYLAIDNAKRALAAEAQSATEQSDAVQQLLHELEALEKQVYQTMPFKLTLLLGERRRFQF